MIIDVHSHVFAFPKATTFLSAEQQIGLMDTMGVDKAVILPVAIFTSGAEAQSIGEVLHICERYPGRFIPFCNLDPRIGKRPDHIGMDDFVGRLEQYKELGCKGLGEVTVRIYFDDPIAMAMFGACERVGFPVTFHTTTAETDSYGLLDEIGLPRFERVLQKFPGLKFIGHSQAFWSEIGGGLTCEEKIGYPSGPVKPGGRVPELMRRYPNLNGDLSAGSGLNAVTRDPGFCYEFIDEFQDRLLFGIDTCAMTNNMPHVAKIKAMRDEKHITPEVYEKIMWRNANRILGLGL